MLCATVGGALHGLRHISMSKEEVQRVVRLLEEGALPASWCALPLSDSVQSSTGGLGLDESWVIQIPSAQPADSVDNLHIHMLAFFVVCPHFDILSYRASNGSPYSGHLENVLSFEQLEYVLSL